MSSNTLISKWNNSARCNAELRNIYELLHTLIDLTITNTERLNASKPKTTRSRYRRHRRRRRRRRHIHTSTTGSQTDVSFNKNTS
jgi:hypothetical protein